MEQLPDTHSFPSRDESARIQSLPEDEDKKEKYIREAGKIEDLPDNADLEKMNNTNDTRNPTVFGGEEKK